jgi:hypothetical protein
VFEPDALGSIDPLGRMDQREIAAEQNLLAQLGVGVRV